MNISELVNKKLQGVFKEDDIIELIDEKHDGKHYLLRVVSDNFAGKSRLERSRIIYALLGEYMKDDYIHALRMELKTFEEV